jgi:hypothetical protein
MTQQREAPHVRSRIVDYRRSVQDRITSSRNFKAADCDSTFPRFYVHGQLYCRSFVHAIPSEEVSAPYDRAELSKLKLDCKG